MEVVALFVLAALLARGARFLGAMYGRALQAGAGPLGLVVARPRELGWPTGVQEEDRDRIWSWAPPPQAAEGDLIDREVAPVPVRRVR